MTNQASRNLTERQEGIGLNSQQEHRRRWRMACIFLVFVLGGILSWRQISSPDIGFHLSFGRWIFEHGAFPRTDPFTFTCSKHPCIDLQWLVQLAFYGANQAGGTALLQLLKLILTFTFWGLLLLRSYRRERGISLAAALLLVPVALADFYEERPQLFSLVYGSTIFLILEEYARGNRRWLTALPVIMLLWVNSHSLFVLGLVGIGVHAIWELRKGARSDRRLLAVALVSGLVCLINPYGIQGVLVPLSQFRDIQEAQIYKASASAIWELQSPFSIRHYFSDDRFILFQVALQWHIYSALTMVGLIGCWRRSRVPEIILTVLFFYIFWKANKNFSYFVMATFPLVAGGLNEVGTAFWQWVNRRTGKTRAFKSGWGFFSPQLGIGTIAAAILVLIVMAGTGRLYRLGWTPQRMGLGFNGTFLPVEACQFLKHHGLEGRVLTTFSNGGYVHWATRLPVSVYGNTDVIGPEFYKQYIASKSPEGFPGFLSRWQPTIAVVPFAEAPFWLHYLSRRRDWRLVQHDDTYALFVHESVPGPAPSPRPVAGIDFPEYGPEELRIMLSAAAVRETMTLRHWWRGSEAIPQSAIRLSAFHFQRGELEACIGIAAKALQESELLVPELFLTLGHALNTKGNHELADLCFSTFLKADPDAPERAEIAGTRARRPGSGSTQVR